MPELPPEAGASADAVGGPKKNEPSRTATSKPVSRLSIASRSQSVCAAWLRCGYTVVVAVTVPTLRLASRAIWVAMSDAVIWTKLWVCRRRSSRWVWSYPRMTVNVPPVSNSASIAVISPWINGSGA